MQNNIKNDDKYYNEQDKINILRMREVLDTLPRFCKQFFRGIEPTTSARTRLGYAYDLRTFFEYLHNVNPSLSKKDIRDYDVSILNQIEREDIEEYLEYLSLYAKDDREITNNEQGKKRKMSALRSMYSYFYKSEQISRNTAELINMPKLHEHEIIRLEPNEVATLLDQVEAGEKLTKAQLKYHEKTKLRDVALLTLLLGTGIRVSECVGIDFDDIDFDTNGLRIHRKGGYNTVVYFPDEVREALLTYINQRKEIIPEEGSENALFLSLQNKRISVRAVEKLVKKYAQNVTTLKKITPHKLRSTFGTNLYQESGDIYLVADVLGHKDVNTTRKHYAAQDDANRRKAAKMVHLRD
ncbi:tyrosine recombinase XerC1 [Butyrivibrio proteoclasticus B316]|uniref:Tyrosine recombinase XerC1 n=1 Tax=Butyrivibrio proteoclasticus (strain ATCC 51982 / DSM 14932 / B316) TaxID=515622 RepID=E0RUX7_BUTPB|nr:tyrosine-type recombinase/integrase [Butyrivibrio proteoclasticus]ADL34168.1 tyrosine recombinase XerC1 [Butyrivibrio proteoclasticus B316]